MNLKFKKIASILASAILLGSTVGFASVSADLGAYPKPFVEGGVADVSIIYGAAAQTIDLESANLFSSDLSSELAGQTSTGTTSTTSVSGEGIPLSLSSRAIFFNDSMNIARTTIVESDLPVMLKSGNVVDNDGISYPYTQKITLPTATRLYFGSSNGESIDPVLYLDVGSGTAADSGALYNYTVTLSKQLEVNATAVLGYASIKLQNIDYTVGPSSTGDSLVLLGAGTTITVKNGQDQKVTLAGVEHTLKLSGTTGTNLAVLEVDGKSKDLTQGASTNYPGDIIVYAKAVHQYSTTDMSQNSVEIIIGTKKLTVGGNTTVSYVKDGSTVTMTGTYATNTNSSNLLSAFTIGQAFKDSSHDYIAIGESLTDRVFGGVKLDFASVSPALDSPLRDEVVIETDNCMKVGVTFTSAFYGKPYTLWYAMDSDKSCSATAWNPTIANEGNKTIHVNENDTINKDELVIVNANDEGRIWKLTAAGDGSSSSKTIFKDVMTDEDISFDTGTNNYSQKGLYYVQVNNRANSLLPEVKLTYGSGATYNNTGSQVTVFPRIKLKNGEWMSILTQTTINNASTYILPGKELLSDYEAGTTFGDIVNITENGSLTGYVNYTYSGVPTTATNDTGLIYAVDTNSTTLAANRCYFNTSTGPSILLMEEKRSGLAETDGRYLCVPLTTWALSGVNVPKVNTPRFNGVSSGFVQLYTDATRQQAVDKYGTFVEYGQVANTGGKVTIKYPDNMMTANIYVSEVGATATTTEASASGVIKLGDVIMTDTEAEAQKPSTNLIVIGGSAVNKVSAGLLELDYPTYGGNQKWQDATGVTGEGQAIIKLMKSPYTDTQQAMLIAGWSGADTMAAAKEVIDKNADLVGKDLKNIGTTVAVQ